MTSHTGKKVYITFYPIILKNKWGKFKTNVWEKIIKYLELKIGVYPLKVGVGIDFLYKTQKYNLNCIKMVNFYMVNF